MTIDVIDPPPHDSDALRCFLRQTGIDPSAPRGELLEQVGAAFSRMPYENLTKIVADDARPASSDARRTPLEVLEDHAALGTGGTCFSLTAALLHVLRGLGFAAEPILADRWYGANTHCALIVEHESRTMLLDPGYLIARPVPLPVSEPVRSCGALQEILLSPRGGGARVELATVEGSAASSRLTYRVEPASPDAFLAAWDASFSWDMMRYPVLTKATGASQLYLQGCRLRVRTAAGVVRRELSPEELPGVIAREFGLRASVAQSALAILRRKGEAIGTRRA